MVRVRVRVRVRVWGWVRVWVTYGALVHKGRCDEKNQEGFSLLWLGYRFRI